MNARVKMFARGLLLLTMAAAAAAQQPAVTQGPTIQYADDRFAVITWTSAQPSSSSIVYGTDQNNLSQRAMGAANTTSHRVEIPNLQANTTYFFQVDEGGAPADILSFQTQASGAPAVHDQQPKLVAKAQSRGGLEEAPRVEYASDSTLVLTWRTATPAGSQIYYGPQSGQLTQQAGDTQSTTFHRVHLTGLQPSSLYYFQVETSGGRSDIYTAQTVAAGQAPVSGQAAMRYGPAPGQFAQRLQAAAGHGPATGASSEIPEGTVIKATLDTALSSTSSTVGQNFTATVQEPVRAADGSLAVPAGAKIAGEVTEVEQGKTLPQLRGRGKLNMHFREIEFADGRVAPITATLASVNDTRTNDEGEVQSSTKASTAAKGVGIGAGLGTVAGLIFGGALKGLLIGAVAGGGYVLATQGKDVELPVGTGMQLRLDHAVAVPAAASQRR